MYHTIKIFFHLVALQLLLHIWDVNPVESVGVFRFMVGWVVCIVTVLVAENWEEI